MPTERLWLAMREPVKQLQDASITTLDTINSLNEGRAIPLIHSAQYLLNACLTLNS